MRKAPLKPPYRKGGYAQFAVCCCERRRKREGGLYQIHLSKLICISFPGKIFYVPTTSANRADCIMNGPCTLFTFAKDEQFGLAARYHVMVG